MTVIGALAGFFVVPMNAMLQHRGHVLMGAGHSIAVQNFNENIGVLVMLVVLRAAGLPRRCRPTRSSCCSACSSPGRWLLVMWRHRINLAAAICCTLASRRAPGAPTRGTKA